MLKVNVNSKTHRSFLNSNKIHLKNTQEIFE